MKLVLTPEQVQLRETFADLFASKCPTTLVRELKESDIFPEELWRALADAGAFGLPFPARYGGQDGGLFELGLLYAEAGVVLCPSVVYDTFLFGIAVHRLGSEAHRERYLPALCAGDLVASVAAPNPSDALDLRPRLRAERTADGWRLNGVLDFVSYTSRTELVLATASEHVWRGPGRVLGFLLRLGAPGWQAEPLTTIARDRCSRVSLVDYHVPDDAVLLGPDERGLAEDDLGWVAEVGVALQCMEMAGGARAVLDQTVEYVKRRHQFGRPIASFQAAQHHVANMRIGVDAGRLAAYAAVWWLGQGGRATRQVAIAKRHCSEAYKWTTLHCHQLQGGMGYVRETDLHLWSERAKVTELRGGDADVATRWLAREVGLAA